MAQNTLSCTPLEHAFSTAGCCPDAVEFLNIVWRSIQFIDDVQDGDKPKTSTTDFMHDMFFTLHTNLFYINHFQSLNSAIFVMIAKWHAANVFEERGEPTHLSFVWRAGFYDLALLVFYLCKGYKNGVIAAPTILSYYGEDYNAYIQEFKKCPTPYQQ